VQSLVPDRDHQIGVSHRQCARQMHGISATQRMQVGQLTSPAFDS
jgi:hypothetical protein